MELILDSLIEEFPRFVAVGGGLIIRVSILLVPAWLLFTVLSIPFRRQERGRTFVLLLQWMLQQGSKPERDFNEILSAGSEPFGRAGERVALALAEGASLGQALRSAPGMLPQWTSALIQAGEHTGELPNTVRAWHDHASDATSGGRGTVNYLTCFLYGSIPMIPAILGLLFVVVYPKLNQIFTHMGASPPPLLQWAAGLAKWCAVASAGVLVTLVVIGLMYAYERFASNGAGPIGRWIDAVTIRLPWRRRRALRDFAATLAVMLDADVPEARSLEAAGIASGSRRMRHRAARACADLEQGRGLVDSVRHVDPSGQLKWRLENAAAGPNRQFVEALTGWVQTLDARAFRSEQIFSQTLSTLMILLTGAVVGVVCIGTFQGLIGIIEQEALW